MAGLGGVAGRGAGLRQADGNGIGGGGDWRGGGSDGQVAGGGGANARQVVASTPQVVGKATGHVVQDTSAAHKAGHTSSQAPPPALPPASRAPPPQAVPASIPPPALAGGMDTLDQFLSRPIDDFFDASAAPRNVSLPSISRS